MMFPPSMNTFMEAISASDVERDAEGNVFVHGETHAIWTSKIPFKGSDHLTGWERPGA